MGKIILRASPESCPYDIYLCAGLAPWACNQYSYMRPFGLGLGLCSHHLEFLNKFMFVFCKWSSVQQWRTRWGLEASAQAGFHPLPPLTSPGLVLHSWPLSPWRPGPSQSPHLHLHLAVAVALCTQLQLPMRLGRICVRWSVPRQLGAGHGDCGPHPEAPVSEHTKQDSLGA